MIEKIADHSFYREFYSKELRRKGEIDSSISYPTTLITLLIGAAFFLFQSDKFGYKPDDKYWAIVLLIITTSLFGALIFISISLLIIVYLNAFKKYRYLPSPDKLKDREIELFDHYYDFFKKSNVKKPQKRAILWAKSEFKKDLLGYWIEYSTTNQMLNDQRIKKYYSARKYLMFSIILLALTGLLILIK